MDIQVQVNLNAVLKMVSQIVMALFQRQAPELFYKKGVYKDFAKFTGKHLCRSIFFNKIEKDTPTHLFSVNLAKFLKTPFFQNTSGDCFCISFEEKTHTLHYKLEGAEIHTLHYKLERAKLILYIVMLLLEMLIQSLVLEFFCLKNIGCKPRKSHN